MVDGVMIALAAEMMIVVGMMTMADSSRITVVTVGTAVRTDMMVAAIKPVAKRMIVGIGVMMVGVIGSPHLM